MPQLKLIQCSLSSLLPLLLLTPKLPVFTGSMMTESVSYPTLRTLSPVFMYINVYSCGQTRHLPTSLRSFGRSFHLEAPRSMPELGLGLRSCLRHKGSYSFLGLLGTALLGEGGRLLHWQRSTPTLGLEVLAAPACPTPIAAPNLKNSCSTGWILCSSSPALEGLCTEPAAEDVRDMLDSRQKLLD